MENLPTNLAVATMCVYACVCVCVCVHAGPHACVCTLIKDFPHSIVILVKAKSFEVLMDVD